MPRYDHDYDDRDPRQARDGRPRDPRTRETRDPRDPRREDLREREQRAPPRDPRDYPRDDRESPRERDDGRRIPIEIGPTTGPYNDYFLPGDGINRDVITTDLCRYLGSDAKIRRYKHADGREGYLITAYRALTSAMISTIKADSKRWDAEQERRRHRGDYPGDYNSSSTFGERNDRGPPLPGPRYQGIQSEMDIDDDESMQRSDPRLDTRARRGDPYDALGELRADPRMADSRLTDPRMTDPRMADPRMTDPRMADPRMTDPRMTDPRMTDPRMADPRMADPRMGDPRLMDSRYGQDPRQQSRYTQPPPLQSNYQSDYTYTSQPYQQQGILATTQGDYTFDPRSQPRTAFQSEMSAVPLPNQPRYAQPGVPYSQPPQSATTYIDPVTGRTVVYQPAPGYPQTTRNPDPHVRRR